MVLLIMICLVAIIVFVILGRVCFGFMLLVVCIECVFVGCIWVMCIVTCFDVVFCGYVNSVVVGIFCLYDLLVWFNLDVFKLIAGDTVVFGWMLGCTWCCDCLLFLDWC